MIYAVIVCLIIIGFLGFKLSQKQKIDKTELSNYQTDLESVKQEWQMAVNAGAKALAEYKDAQKQREYEEEKVERLKQNAKEALQLYHDTIDVRMSEIETSMEEQRQKRQEELDSSLKEKQQYYEKLLQDTINRCSAQDEAIKEASETKWQQAMEQIKDYTDQIAAVKERFESLERTLRVYDLEQQAKLFYTIQLPEEYYEDIEFLLTTVAAKVQHPDIISKLVWQEYVKPNLDNTFKRLEIKTEPGIYKLTSLQNGKCYTGKSTNVKGRITDHFKSVVGITSIADQAVHHAIRKEGFWNWTIEIITYCEKDKLSELEKYYIEFFKAQEFGYNKTGGG